MAKTHDRDFIRRYRENDAVVPDPQPKMALPLTAECFNVTGAGFTILGRGKKDSNCGLAVDSPQLGS
jgi:hypothetical protein